MNEFLGRYRIVGEIGQGAMGTVYKAVDPVIDRTVAIKTINLNLTKDELSEYAARFAQEIKVAGRLNHPNIVTIFDVGKTEEIAYMAMEFLEGQELKDLLASGKPLPVGQTVDIIAQVAEGLWFAHRQDIVHRDVKPSNIIVLDNGTAKVTDFGIARLPDSAVRTMTGLILGSPRYMSPEQVVGKTLDARTDIFSLGVVLYEALTAHAPFDGDNVSAVMYAIVNTAPAPPSTRNAGVPPMLDLIVAKALAKSVDERYQTLKEMRDDLRELQRQLPPVPRVEAPRPPVAPSSASPQPDTATIVLPADGHFDKGLLHEDEPAKALKIAKAFDSFEATVRLARMTQQVEEFDEYITDTQKLRAYRGKFDAGGAQHASVPRSPDARAPSAEPRTAPARPAAAKPAPLFPEGEGANLASILLVAVLSIAVIALLVALLTR